MSLEETKNQLEAKLKDALFLPSFINIRERDDKNAPLTEKVLDDYMIENNYLPQEKSWLELSRKSAKQHLSFSLFEAVGSFYSNNYQEKGITEITDKFLNLFSSNARFFCNGLFHRLDEYPIIEGTSSSFYGLFPFYTIKPHKTGYSSFNSLVEDYENEIVGVVAVDDEKIGFLFVKAAWNG